MNKAAPRRHTSHRLPPWIVLILSLATIGMILGVDLRATHEDLTQREGERLAHAADVVGSTLSRSLQSTTVALDAIAPDLLQILAGRDEVGDVNSLVMHLDLNGKRMQTGWPMIWRPAAAMRAATPGGSRR